MWNAGWKPVIPANTLLNTTSEGLSRFPGGVRDISRWPQGTIAWAISLVAYP